MKDEKKTTKTEKPITDEEIFREILSLSEDVIFELSASGFTIKGSVKDAKKAKELFKNR